MDGVTRCIWDVCENHTVRLELDADAELIEVVAQDSSGEFPLLSSLIPFDPESGRQQAVEASLELADAGRRISLRVSPPRTGRGAELELRYSKPEASTVDAAAR